MSTIALLLLTAIGPAIGCATHFGHHQTVSRELGDFAPDPPGPALVQERDHGGAIALTIGPSVVLSSFGKLLGLK